MEAQVEDENNDSNPHFEPTDDQELASSSRVKRYDRLLQTYIGDEGDDDDDCLPDGSFLKESANKRADHARKTRQSKGSTVKYKTKKINEIAELSVDDDDDDASSDGEQSQTDVNSSTNDIDDDDDQEQHVNSSQKQKVDDDESQTGGTRKFLLLTFILTIILATYSIQKQDSTANAKNEQDYDIDFSQIDDLDKKYPNLLSPKEVRIIKARLTVMPREVSILALVGKSRDNFCKFDHTYCIGKTIANVTRARYEYIDASKTDLSSAKIEQVLGDILNGNRNTVLIDSLEQLPGTHVMNLFQFIDKDESQRRRGMLLFVVYAGLDRSEDYVGLKDAEILENVLNEKWSRFIPKDSLTSVISRISGSVVKVF